jgi:hypothetical protein
MRASWMSLAFSPASRGARSMRNWPPLLVHY